MAGLGLGVCVAGDELVCGAVSLMGQSVDGCAAVGTPNGHFLSARVRGGAVLHDRIVGDQHGVSLRQGGSV